MAGVPTRNQDHPPPACAGGWDSIAQGLSKAEPERAAQKWTDVRVASRAGIGRGKQGDRGEDKDAKPGYWDCCQHGHLQDSAIWGLSASDTLVTICPHSGQERGAFTHAIVLPPRSVHGLGWVESTPAPPVCTPVSGLITLNLI